MTYARIMGRVSPDTRRLRRKLGWTQRELAEHLDVDPVTVSRWERRVTEPKAGALKRILRLSANGPAGRPSSAAASQASSRHHVAWAEASAIGELVRIVGTEEALHALRERALLKRGRSSTRLPVDPAVRLREVEAALREQSELISRAAIE